MWNIYWSIAMDRIFGSAPPQMHIYVETKLPVWWCPEVGLLEDDQVMRVELPWMGLVPLQKRSWESSCSLSTMWVNSEKMPL